MARAAVQLLEDFEALPGDVAALLQRAGAVDFQAGLGWWTNFVRHVDLGSSTARLAVWRDDGGVPVAMLPLCLQRGTVSALGNYYTTRWGPGWRDAGLDVAARTEILAALLKGVLRTAAPVHTLRFIALQAGSADETALHAALRRCGCAVFPFHSFHNWQLPVSTDWPSYLATRDGRLRTTLSRMGKRFAARGGRLELLQGGPSLEAGIAAYQRVYAASWKDPEPHPQFMPGLVRAAAASGQLRMGIAWLVDEPIAAQVWLQSGRRADIYKLAHDERHKDLSPGSLLTQLLMRQALEVDHVECVDYLSGDDAYKRLWMSEVHERRGLVAYPLNSMAGLAGAAKATLGDALRRLKRPVAP
jgi:hypothetical protein